MGRRPDEEMQAIIDAIATDLNSKMKRDVLTISANELAREYGIQQNTACDILRDLGYEYDGVYWFKVGEAGQ
jgi:hypothetical protein